MNIAQKGSSTGSKFRRGLEVLCFEVGGHLVGHSEPWDCRRGGGQQSGQRPPANLLFDVPLLLKYFTVHAAHS